jgi:Calcium-dependent channel, 7TM region, putative phosphate
LDHPEDFVTFLANSLPAQSSYFIQIIFVFTFFVHSGELLRVYPLGLALVRRFVGPNLTKKERKQKWGWIHSLEDPPDFFHAETFAHVVSSLLFDITKCVPLTNKDVFSHPIGST